MTTETKDSAFMDRVKMGEKFNCPCCGRYAQVYRRRIHHSVARQLGDMMALGGGRERRFVHASILIPHGNTGTGDIGKAAYWGLIEKMKHVSGQQKSSGYWRLTGHGVDFVEGRVKIMAVALVFDDEVIGFDGKEVSFLECLDVKFDYTKNMEGDL